MDIVGLIAPDVIGDVRGHQPVTFDASNSTGVISVSRIDHRCDIDSRMPRVSEMTDDEVVKKVHGRHTFRGFPSDHMHELLIRALALAPDDPVVLARALRLWSYFAKPVAEGYSSVGPARPDGIPLHRTALDNAERVLAATPVLDTPALRVLFWWAKQTRMMLRITSLPVSAADLEAADAESNAVYDEFQNPDLEDEDEELDASFRLLCSARLRALQLVAGGPPYDPRFTELLAGYIKDWDWNLGWPVAPLVNDPVWRAHVTGVLAERTAAKSHLAPASVPWLEELVARDQPAPEELDGRIMLIAWLLGIDEPAFVNYAQRAISSRAPGVVLDRLLTLGFDPNAVDSQGNTLLHTAVLADHTEAIRALIAAGADPAREGTGDSQQSALALAQVRNRASVIRALTGDDAASASETELATALRDTAARLDPRSLVWTASLFGISKPEPVRILELVLARRPESPEEILADANRLHPFDRYVIARVLRDAGHVIDRTLTGPVILTDNITLSGSLTVEGALVDSLNQASIIVANDLRVHGFATEADTIIGGTLYARDYVWGSYNDGSLVVNTGVQTPLLVMTDHTYECEGDEQIGRKLIDAVDAHPDVFVAAVLDGHSPDRERAVALVKDGEPIIRASGSGAAPGSTQTALASPS